LAHSKINWFHSLNNPQLSRKRKITNKLALLKLLYSKYSLKKGNKIISSTSKIIKTKAIKKKCKLNLSR